MKQTKPETLLPISVVAARSGLSVSAVRFYEERGLVSSRQRVAGRRVYGRSVLRRLAFIAAAQKVGLSIAEVQAAMNQLPAERAPSPKEWGQLSEPWKARIDQRISELEELRRSLEDCIGCGCLSMSSCGILNPSDQAAAQGPGARWRMPSKSTPRGAIEPESAGNPSGVL